MNKNPSARTILALVALIAVASLFSPSARAATVTWDASGSANGGAATDGAGTWSTGSAKWDASPSDAVWTNSNDAVIGNGGTAGTITVSGGVTVDSITFNPVASGTYTIAGSTITLTGSDLITTNAASATISSVLAGATGLNISGTGALTLSGLDTYTGGTIVNAGTLNLADEGQPSGTSGDIGGALTINSGATVNANSDWTLGVETSGNYVTSVTINSGTLNWVGSAGGGGSPATITMTGGAITGSGWTWNQPAASVTTGTLATNASSNTAVISAPVATRFLTSITFNVAPGTTTSGTDLLVSGAITTPGGNGTCAVIKTGSGVLDLTGANNYAGGTQVNGGILEIGNGSTNGTIGSGSYSIASGATLRLDYATVSAPTWANISGAGTFDIFATNAATTFVDWGTPSLPSGFTGTLLVEDGRIDALSGSGAFGNASAIQINNGGQLLAGGGTFSTPITISGTGALESGNPAALRFLNNMTWAGNITLAANATIEEQVGSSSMTGSITGNYQLNLLPNGNAGSGDTLTITPSAAVQNSYGSTEISSGAVIAGNQYAFSTGALLMNGGTLELNNNSFSFANLSGSAGTIENNGSTTASTITVGTDNTSTNYSGTLIDGGSKSLGLSKAGTGTLTLGGTNTYSGATTIGAGTLLLDNTNALQNSVVSIGVTNGLTFSNAASSGTSYTIGGLSGSSNLTLTDTGSGAVNLIIGNNNNTGMTYSGILSGAGSLTKVGTGTQTLSGANTYSGATTISAGAVLLANANAAQDSVVSIGVTNGLTFSNAASSGTSYTIGGLSGGSNLALTDTGSGAVNLVIGNNNNTGLTYSGALSGSGSLTKVGTGVQTLTGANSYSGGTAINGGTLQIGNGSTNGTIGSGTYSIASSATLRLDYSSVAAPSWSKISGAGTLDLFATNAQSSFQDWGTPSLPTTFTGTLLVEDGRFETSGGPTNLGNASAIQINNGGQLLAYGGYTYNTPITISGTGALESGNPAALRLYSSGTWAGSITLAANATIEGQTSNWNVTGAITGGGYQLNLLPNGNAGSGDTLTITPSAAVQNSYGSTEISSGAVIAGNQYAFSTGALLMNGGTLELNNNSFSFANLSGTSTASIIENNGSTTASTITVGTDNTSTSYSGTLVNGGSKALSLSKSGTGTLTLSAANTYTGATTVGGGTLIVSGSLSGTASVSATGGSTLEVDGLVNHSATTSLTGGTLQGTGSAGAVTLASASTLAPGYTASSGFGSSTSLSAGSVTFSDTASTLSIGVGIVSGSDNTQLTSSGTVTLDKTPLQLTLGNALNNPSNIGLAYIILNGGAGATGSGSDVFSYGGVALANTNTFTTPGGFTFEVIYGGLGVGTNDIGNANDVELVLTAVPEPGAWATIALGFGMLVGLQRRRRLRLK